MDALEEVELTNRLILIVEVGVSELSRKGIDFLSVTGA